MNKTAGTMKRGYGRFVLFFVFALVCFCGTCAAVFAEGDTPAGNNAELKPENGIPLVIVRVDETTRTIDQMNASPDHSARCEDATIEIKLPEGYTAQEGYSAVVPEGEKDLKYIRGRGNMTWDCNKKPYKEEMNKAIDLFGMGASTDWSLIANSFDTSLMRNRITFWLGEKMGLDYTPKQVPVDLVMIGTESGEHWYGSYCISETINIEESRINIGKLKKDTIDNITGGYLLATYSDQEG
ncbi:MAG: CotH kinase family protein [Firmicutes bacterium]|nr:CotH kinase family protein [Bacillota bacterium]